MSDTSAADRHPGREEAAAAAAAWVAAAPPPPVAAGEVFGPELDRARAYAGALATAGIERGLLGPRERDRLWARHLLNSAALAAELPAGVTAIDVGSGAGLPGIPLALARPDIRMTLVEPLERRVAFLREVADVLELPVHVLRARAEELPHETADVVVVRAVAPLQRLVPLLLPLVRPGGRVLALKGRQAADEIAQARGELSQWPHVLVDCRTTGQGETAVTIVRMQTSASSGSS